MRNTAELSAMPLRLLMVEDDADLATTMSDELRGFGHDVTVAADGQQALCAIAQNPFDAVILDRMLPLIDGMSVLQRMREQDMTMAVVMLSALTRSAQKVEGLEAGADDYVAKPVPAPELNARVQAVLRGRRWTRSGADTLRAGDIVISPTTFRAWRGEKPIDLPKLELGILIELAKNIDTVVTRKMLLERVWRFDFEPGSNIVEAYIRRLRLKLTMHGDPDPIVTVRGAGYILRS